ncbi:MAG: zinc dependent phospholipase C family protein [Treponema sp.]|jgi:hypothetical protein|nr:zinc dependent phospholipase C family protein [Treponema sp.]
MPSQVLHTLFGEDIITGIHRLIVPRYGIIADKALEKIQVVYKTAFTLGCQGPDIFYHNRRRPVGLEYGSLLHRRGAGIFTAGLLRMSLPDPPPDEEDIRKGRREKGINALGAYALGFMTHAILDRAAHPYIVYKTAYVPPVKNVTRQFAHYHMFFERILDVLMLKELRGEEIVSWDQEKILAEICEKPPLGFRELLARALELAFPERAGKDSKLSLRIENTLDDCARFYRMTAPHATSYLNAQADRTNLTYERIAYLFPENLNESNSGIDFLNLKHAPWHYPLEGSAPDNRSFPDLYSQAVESAVESISPVITAYLDTGIFPIAEAARAIGNHGLSIIDKENGKPCAPSLSAPLPLEEVIEEQAILRGVGS